MKLTLLAAVLSLPWAAYAADVAVPVLKQSVHKGEVISAENIMSKPVPSSQVFASTVTDAAQLAGLQAIRPLAAQMPLNKMHLRLAPAVARNASVTLRFRQGGVELTGKGQALEDAALGGSVRVLNPATRATLVGTVAEDNIVDIN
jgi:flagella basal body P-ring formation protein FlgA